MLALIMHAGFSIMRANRAVQSILMHSLCMHCTVWVPVESACKHMILQFDFMRGHAGDFLNIHASKLSEHAKLALNHADSSWDPIISSQVSSLYMYAPM